MIASERSLFILKNIQQQGVINVKDTAHALGVSEATVRRDFEKLEQQGRLVRVQGGAMYNAQPEAQLAELSMRSKMALRFEAKQKVAEAAAQIVEDGEKVFLDSGTSITPLAGILLQRPVTLITHSTLMLEDVQQCRAEVIVVGGRYKAGDHMCIGPMAQRMMELFYFDHAFIGCPGISLQNGKAYTLEMENIKNLAIAHTRQKHLLLDSTKLEKPSFYAFATLEEFDTIFCDDPGDSTTFPANFTLV